MREKNKELEKALKNMKEIQNENYSLTQEKQELQKKLMNLGESSNEVKSILILVFRKQTSDQGCPRGEFCKASGKVLPTE